MLRLGSRPELPDSFIVEQTVNPAYDKIEMMDLHPSRE